MNEHATAFFETENHFNMSCIHSFILFVKAAITDNGTGQQGTKLHLQLPSNFTDIHCTRIIDN